MSEYKYGVLLEIGEFDPDRPHLNTYNVSIPEKYKEMPIVAAVHLAAMFVHRVCSCYPRNGYDETLLHILYEVLGNRGEDVRKYLEEKKDNDSR